MNIFQNMWSALGLGVPMDEVEYEEDNLEEYPGSEAGDWEGEHSANQRRLPAVNKIVGMPGRGNGQTEVLLVEPRSFEEIPQVVAALKQRKAVILNLSLMDADTAQRCVDFVAGGAFAIDGHQQRVGETIFLFTPNFVQISNYSPGDIKTLEYPAPPHYPAPPQRPTPAPAW